MNSIWIKIKFNSAWDAMVFNANIGHKLTGDCTIHNEPDDKLKDNIIKYILSNKTGIKDCKNCIKELNLKNTKISILSDY